MSENKISEAVKVVRNMFDSNVARESHRICPAEQRALATVCDAVMYEGKTAKEWASDCEVLGRAYDVARGLQCSLRHLFESLESGVNPATAFTCHGSLIKRDYEAFSQLLTVYFHTNEEGAGYCYTTLQQRAEKAEKELAEVRAMVKELDAVFDNLPDGEWFDCPCESCVKLVTAIEVVRNRKAIERGEVKIGGGE